MKMDNWFPALYQPTSVFLKFRVRFTLSKPLWGTQLGKWHDLLDHAIQENGRGDFQPLLDPAKLCKGLGSPAEVFRLHHCTGWQNPGGGGIASYSPAAEQSCQLFLLSLPFKGIGRPLHKWGNNPPPRLSRIHLVKPNVICATEALQIVKVY